MTRRGAARGEKRQTIERKRLWAGSFNLVETSIVLNFGNPSPELFLANIDLKAILFVLSG